MNETTSRTLIVAGLSANVLLLALAMLDHSIWDSEHMWPIFTSWAFLIILLVVLAFVTSGVRIHVSTPHVTHVQPAAAPQPVARPATPATPTKPMAKPAPGATASTGPFRFNGYTLYSRDMELKGDGTRRTIFFFAKREPKSGHPVAKPAGYHVGVNERTGLPFLKKGAGPDGEDLTPQLEHAYRPQCSAVTDDGRQCRNSARSDSKYCASHFGYQPKVLAKAEADRIDSMPRVRKAADTKPARRKRVAA